MSLLNELVDEIKETAPIKKLDSATYDDFYKFLGTRPVTSDLRAIGVSSDGKAAKLLRDSLLSLYADKKQTQENMEKLEAYKSPQQVDEAIQRLIEHYFEDEQQDWKTEDCPEDHIVHAWNILKTLYEQGGPDKVF